MSKNVMLKASYNVGKALELVERQFREAGYATQGVFGRKPPRLRLVTESAQPADPVIPATDSTRVEYAIPLNDSNAQFFDAQEIAKVLVILAKTAGRFTCAVGPGVSFGNTVSIDLVLWSSAVVAKDKVDELRAELAQLQPGLKQDSIFAALSPSTVEFLVADRTCPDEKLAG
jgi:hypothetical protein